MPNKPKLIVITGPTSSGKTSLSIKLAKKFNGQIISADSRQIYKGMDIGTGKATKQEQRQAKHYLLDVVKPTTEFNVSHFKKKALSAIKKIYKQGKIPILTGGTGFWIQAVIDDINLPKVKPNKILRHQLAKKTAQQLYQILKRMDRIRASNIDQQNPYRLIRAIEIIKATNRPVPRISKQAPFDTLMLAIKTPRQKLYHQINNRIKARLKKGMIAEVKHLHKQGVSWQRLYYFGLEYRFVNLYLRGKITKPQMIEQLTNASHQYAKRQLTWLNKDKRYRWISNYRQAEIAADNFLKK
ncbi:tRNA (adenosine(37)-N6)-dimethylallyltransferase MiaA [Patescibacteria group bacterium]|nr:tRNA (adenosine(37)-N6)-dimethylallyltransferase MiaA [Patescibacteria group bacterium]MBU0964093.1 tRNA (adenosine(37)-N6)-dimethylallyltransferase MiaA [Patescibacteria group bacterium]